MATEGRKDKFSLLIDEDSHGWDVGIVYHYFQPKIAHEILNINLLPYAQPNRLIWNL